MSHGHPATGVWLTCLLRSHGRTSIAWCTLSDLSPGRSNTLCCAGLAPEAVEYGMVPDPGGRYNLLRPEAAEAAFYLWRVTGKQQYRDWVWDMVQAFERHSRVRLSNL